MTLFHTWRAQVLLLDPSTDASVLQGVLESCRDYFELVTGLPADKDEATRMFQALPEGKGCEDKFLLGIFSHDAAPIGVIDAIRDYPELGVWTLGLLVLRPDQRSMGLGEEVYREFERWAAGSGAKVIRIGVAANNGNALRFWSRLGFEPKERKRMKAGLIEQDLDVLAKST